MNEGGEKFAVIAHIHGKPGRKTAQTQHDWSDCVERVCVAHTWWYLNNYKKNPRLFLVTSLGLINKSRGSKTPLSKSSGALQRGVAVETKHLHLNCLPWPFLFCRRVFRWRRSTKPHSLGLSATRSCAVHNTMDALQPSYHTHPFRICIRASHSSLQEWSYLSQNIGSFTESQRCFAATLPIRNH